MNNIKITSIDDFYKYIDANVYKHTDIVSLNIDINELSKDNKQDAQLIIDCLNYAIQNGKLTPFFIDPYENPYPDIKIITDRDIDLLTNYVNKSKNLYVKAHINHFLFIKTKCKNKVNFAYNAINAYFNLYEQHVSLPKKSPIELLYVLNNLEDLVYRVQYKIDDMKELSINTVKTSHMNILIKHAVEFLIKGIKNKKFNKSVLRGFIKICKMNIQKADNDIANAEFFINLGRQISRVTNGNTFQWDLLQAKACENEMKRNEKLQNHNILASSWCKDAIKYYKLAKNKVKTDKLFKKYNELCKNLEFGTIESPPYNLQDDIAKMKNRIDNSNSIDVLRMLIHEFVQPYQNNKKLAENNLKKFSLTSFIPTTYTDIYGQVIGYASTDEENFKYELWKVYDIGLQMCSPLLFEYISYAIKTNKLNVNIILSYLNTTWFGTVLKKQLSGEYALSYQWLEHIAEPIISYFDKIQKYLLDNNFKLSFINEVDSLTLKIEGIIRDLAEFAQIESFSVRKFVNNKNGKLISNWKTLNDLLWDNNIFKIISKNDTWFMRYFLTDYSGLRNDIAHCLLLSPYQEQYRYGFQWLLIILLRLSLYGKKIIERY